MWKTRKKKTSKNYRQNLKCKIFLRHFLCLWFNLLRVFYFRSLPTRVTVPKQNRDVSRFGVQTTESINRSRHLVIFPIGNRNSDHVPAIPKSRFPRVTRSTANEILKRILPRYGNVTRTNWKLSPGEVQTGPETTDHVIWLSFLSETGTATSWWQFRKLVSQRHEVEGGRNPHKNPSWIRITTLDTKNVVTQIRRGKILQNQ